MGEREKESMALRQVGARSASITTVPSMQDKTIIPPHIMLWETLHGGRVELQGNEFLLQFMLSFVPSRLPPSIPGAASIFLQWSWAKK